MIEKRFYIDTIDGGESVLVDNGKELSLNEACNLLNELHKENKQFKKELKTMAKKNKQLRLAQKKQKKSSKKDKGKCSCGFGTTNGQLHLGSMNLCE